jgi:hypothetical protein
MTSANGRKIYLNMSYHIQTEIPIPYQDMVAFLVTQYIVPRTLKKEQHTNYKKKKFPCVIKRENLE